MEYRELGTLDFSMSVYLYTALWPLWRGKEHIWHWQSTRPWRYRGGEHCRTWRLWCFLKAAACQDPQRHRSASSWPVNLTEKKQPIDLQKLCEATVLLNSLIIIFSFSPDMHLPPILWATQTTGLSPTPASFNLLSSSWLLKAKDFL